MLGLHYTQHTLDLCMLLDRRPERGGLGGGRGVRDGEISGGAGGGGGGAG